MLDTLFWQIKHALKLETRPEQDFSQTRFKSQLFYSKRLYYQYLGSGSYTNNKERLKNVWKLLVL